MLVEQSNDIEAEDCKHEVLQYFLSECERLPQHPSSIQKLRVLSSLSDDERTEVRKMALCYLDAATTVSNLRTGASVKSPLSFDTRSYEGNTHARSCKDDRIRQSR